MQHFTSTVAVVILPSVVSFESNQNPLRWQSSKSSTTGCIISVCGVTSGESNGFITAHTLSKLKPVSTRTAPAMLSTRSPNTFKSQFGNSNPLHLKTKATELQYHVVKHYCNSLKTENTLAEMLQDISTHYDSFYL